MSAPDPGETDDLLAAELAFGLLDPAERRAAEARRDADFLRRCDWWRAHAAALLDGVEVAPDPALWGRIAARLPANDRSDVARLRRSRGRWRAASAMLALATVGLGAAVLVERRPAPASPPPRVAAAQPVVVILTGADRRAIVSISFDRATGRIATAVTALHAGGRATELWVIPSDQRPRPLGVIPSDRHAWQAVPAAWAAELVPGATLAISLEPQGGSPTGQPTGPVVLTGKIEAS